MMNKRLIFRFVAAILIIPALSGCSQNEHAKARAARGAGQKGHTVVLDAGHGGPDGGAVSNNGVYEKDINLTITLRTSEIMRFLGVDTVLTRKTADSIHDPEADTIREKKVTDIRNREKIVKSIEDAVFISVHLNKFSESQYRGAQVFYSRNNTAGEELGKTLQASFRRVIDKNNTREAKKAPNDIYLMAKLTCPAVIVECGFLSNPEEERLLIKPDYQKKLAAVIVCGYLEYLEKGG